MLLMIPLDRIVENPFQRRADYGDVAELAESIRNQCEARPDTRGLQQVPNGRFVTEDVMHPLLLVHHNMYATMAAKSANALADNNLCVQLEFGHRRSRAFRHLHESGVKPYCDGLMPVFVRQLTDEQMLDGVYAENAKRRDISAVEEAELLAEKMRFVKSQRELAEAWSVGRSTVANKIRLLQLPESIQQANREGRLSERQCAALLPLMELVEKLPEDNSVQWGEIVDRWQPVAPQHYMEWLAKQERPPTSDDIRQKVQRAIEHAGERVSERVSETSVVGSGIVQATCKRCPHRINQTCLKSVCLRAKRKAFGAIQAKKFAEEFGIPYSDNPDDLKPFSDSYGVTQAARQAWESGQREGFVVGWKVTGRGVYPLSDGASYFSSTYNLAGRYQDGADDMVALGWVGDTPEEWAAADSNDDSVESDPRIDEWVKQSNAVVSELQFRFDRALRQYMARVSDDGLKLALLATNRADFDAGDSLADRLAEKLKPSGRGWVQTYSEAYTRCQWLGIELQELEASDPHQQVVERLSGLVAMSRDHEYFWASTYNVVWLYCEVDGLIDTHDLACDLFDEMLAECEHVLEGVIEDQPDDARRAVSGAVGAGRLSEESGEGLLAMIEAIAGNE